MLQDALFVLFWASEDVTSGLSARGKKSWLTAWKPNDGLKQNNAEYTVLLGLHLRSKNQSKPVNGDVYSETLHYRWIDSWFIREIIPALYDLLGQIQNCGFINAFLFSNWTPVTWLWHTRILWHSNISIACTQALVISCSSSPF